MKACDLTPNPNLPPLERQLQYNLLKLIKEFGTIASTLDIFEKLDDEIKSMWSDSIYEAFNQAIASSPGHWE